MKILRERINRHRSSINCANEENALYSHLKDMHPHTPPDLDLFTLIPIEKCDDFGNNTVKKNSID